MKITENVYPWAKGKTAINKWSQNNVLLVATSEKIGG